MNSLQVFNNAEFGSIRTLTINDEPWFVGKDIAEALGYGNGKSLNNAVANHVDDATAKIAAGIVNCETFELSDSFKKDVNIQGNSIFGGGIVEGYMTTLSDSFKKEMPVDSVASFAGGIVNSVVVEISDSFNESIDVNGSTAMAAGVSITESN